MPFTLRFLAIDNCWNLMLANRRRGIFNPLNYIIWLLHFLSHDPNIVHWLYIWNYLNLLLLNNQLLSLLIPKFISLWFRLILFVNFPHCAQISLFFLLLRCLIRLGKHIFALSSVNVWNALLLLREILLSLVILAISCIFNRLVNEGIDSSTCWVPEWWN